jgi:release factor glutamine methyltransferase
MTLLEVLRSSTAYLEKRQVENARLNAEHLLSHVLGKKRLELYLGFEGDLSEAQLIPLRDLVRRRGQGEPLQHLLGTVEFCGHTFLCDKRAMVPRPETEELVGLLIAAPGEITDGRILDVGIGSGVIALSLAARFPQATVYGVDISAEALALARENAIRLGLEQRVEFRQGNLLENFSERFDLIVANLPYIPMPERPNLSREVLHDPAVALFGGERGDELLFSLIDQAGARLQPGGCLALEIGENQAEPVLARLREKKYKDIQTKNDYSGRPRFIFARYG